jgi:hypothetical protein
LVKETGEVTDKLYHIMLYRENHQPAVSHWQTLSHNVVSSTPHLNGIQTHVSGVRHWLHRWLKIQLPYDYDHDGLGGKTIECTVKFVLRGHLWNKEKLNQYIWKFLWQDKKKVTFWYIWLLNRGDRMGSFDCTYFACINIFSYMS